MSIEINTSNNNNHELSKDLPNNVNSKEELALLPEKYLSNDPKRPLLLEDRGESYTFALNPVTYSVMAILVIECLERLAYYGINNTETAFLTGIYDPNWTAGMTAVSAVSYTSASIAIAYTSPFIGGIVADGFLGDYWSIILGVGVFYIPGLLLVSLTTFPNLLGPTFNTKVLSAGLLGLMPIGTGFIKSIVNVFGAKQFHPLQSRQVESYYVNFYVAINIGALIGGILVPIIAQQSMEVAYLIPLISMSIGFAIFLAYSKRFVKRAPQKTALFNTLKLVGQRAVCKPFNGSKQSNGGDLADQFVDGVKRLLSIAPVALLVLPFNIVYAQMTTVFIIQGEAMEKISVFDASMMSNFDSLSVLVTGIITGSILYPFLEKRGWNIPTTYRFAIGSVFGALSIASALLVDSAIRNDYLNNDSQIAIFWQSANYVFVGVGEVFAVSTVYECAFTIAPKEQKSLASAIQLFLGNGLSSYICIGISQAFASWFPVYSNHASPIERTQAYADSELQNYLWVLFGIALFGVALNIFPPVKNWVERLRSDALDATTMDLSSTVDDSESSSSSSSSSSSFGDDKNKLKSSEEGEEISIY